MHNLRRPGTADTALALAATAPPSGCWQTDLALVVTQLVLLLPILLPSLPHPRTAAAPLQAVQLPAPASKTNAEAVGIVQGRHE